MPFGDSITDGYNSDTQGGYRVELFRLAHSAGKLGTGLTGDNTKSKGWHAATAASRSAAIWL